MTDTFGVLQHGIEASAAGLRRTLDLARRALRAQGAAILAPGAEASDSHAAVLAAAIRPDGEAVATLVVHDAAPRLWSGDDEAMLQDLADGLAHEVVLTRRVAHLDAEPAPGADDAATEANFEPADAATPPEPSDEPDTFHILLADDLDLNRKLICDMLALDGYVVDSVADGAAAVEAAQAKAYDLILMDMIMPGMDGMDATRAIRALPAPACDVPIVALTAHSFREQLDSCLHAGMNATLTKPMSFDALSDAVGTWARSRRTAA